ncbi:MAG: hypothetical protein LQ352_002755 [Teloschistes flavicans]|nr:MAG: hypothetical protein LQ352_002755 [Teloschistes flavicans]
MDSSMVDSAFDVEDSDAFSPEPVKAKKPKAAPKKAAAAPKAASSKLSQTTLKPKKPAASKKRPKPDTEDEDSASERPSLHDDSLLSVTPPGAKKQKKAPAPKKSVAKPLQEVQNEANGFDGAEDAKPKKRSKSSETYQKLTQLEHIIKRPDTYIGSAERSEKQMWVYNSEKDMMEMREISFVPGLYKIFDEILVNAADNKQRDKNMDSIRVTVDRGSGEISVWNNGRGIPIEIHEKEKIYIPEMIFGHLLTSSNYDDDAEKVTGGRNGYGAKLCNIFSTSFKLETADSKSKSRYTQTWTENMAKMGKHSITENKKGDDFTKVTFTPDFKYFKMSGMDDDFEALVKRRVYDLAGTVKGVKVWLNGDKIKVNNFKKYMEMYTKAIKNERGDEAANDTSEIITETPDARWELGFAVSDGSFQQVSFVNSIATTSGGTHVNYIADQVSNKLMDIVKKKLKKEGGAILKANQIRNHIFLFVNCQIVNPAFTSQTKEQLTTKSTQFGSKCTVSDDFMKKIAKTEVVNNILHFAQQKADQILKKSDGNRRHRMDNPKLTDANWAGTKDGYRCTLILTEGDSAKGLAIAGRSVVSADRFGVFPLRGKLLNVRDATIDQISKNQEIQNIKNFLGLKHKTEYKDCKNLRYGHLMIMTDQDHDGSHIKGLLINFLQVQYPSLLKIPEFLVEFITPIVKVYKGDPKYPKHAQTFFTMPEYEAWKEDHKNERGWDHKYYKGLGTSSTEDAQVYFRDLDRHLKEFDTMRDAEVGLIELAFSKKMADERKEWLRQFKPGTYLDMTSNKISYTDFVNKELILFSMADNMRSIPSVVDGLKPGQRKCMYACLKKNLKKDVKVLELAGQVMGMTAYAHGEASIYSTITGLAQTFVGSNNVNCLEPSGNFGSRLQGGSDSASARYIYTRLSPFARRVYLSADEPLLTYNTDDDKTIEPETYMPVVPMVLINGADGIGTGWSSSIPNYNPEDIVENLRLMMNGEPTKPMVPWFRDFKGTVTQTAPDRFKFGGIVQQTGANEVEITELPIRMWTQDFKDKIVDIIKAEKTPSWIKDYDDYNTHKDVHFIIRMDEKYMEAALKEGLEERFKLNKSIATSNLVAFDPEGRITKYATVDDMLKEFYGVRIKFYDKRKQYMLSQMNNDLEKYTNQARFIQMIIDGQLVISRKKKADLVKELKNKNFKPIAKVADASKQGETEPTVENEEENEEDIDMGASSYEYLLGMPLWSLTKERVDKLQQMIGDREMEIDKLIKMSREDLWKVDLDEFINEWRFQLEDEAKRQKKIARMDRRASQKLNIGGAGGKKRKAGSHDSDDSDFGLGISKAQKKAATKQAKIKSAGLLSEPLAKANQPKPKVPKKAMTAPTAAKEVKSEKNTQDDVWMSLSRTDGGASEPPVAPIFQKTKAAATASKPLPPKKMETDEDDNDEDDIVISKPGARNRRAAASKPVSYGIDSESDDMGDDMLFDVGKMVKGINGGTSTTESNSRPLFSATVSSSTRPSSSHGLPKKSSSAGAMDVDVDADDTDYSRLAPPTTKKGPAVTAKQTVLSDEDDDDSFDAMMAAAVAAPKAAPKPAPKATKPPVPKVSAKPAATKASKEAAAKKVPAAVPTKKPLPLSPAAKAYAAKQAKKTKAPVLDDDDSEDEVENLANEIMDDDDDDDEDEVMAAPARAAAAGGGGRGRPARRAAASAPTKKNWVVASGSESESAEEEEEEEEEESAMFDGEESDDY